MENLPRKSGEYDEEDIISTLPDELLHQILSFVDLNVAVQTCVLSKRWVNIWTTLPFLNFHSHHLNCSNFVKFVHDRDNFVKLVNEFLIRRNQQSKTCSIEIDFGPFEKSLCTRIFHYASTHHIQQFMVTDAVIDYPISFPSLRNLSLTSCAVNLVDWSLPSLQTLRCVCGFGPLDGDNMPLSFPLLRNLYLSHCKASLSTWSLPSLTTLYLENITVLNGERQLRFEGFANLKRLTLKDSPDFSGLKVFMINSPNLTSLTISHQYFEPPPTCTFLVSAPNLSSFIFEGNWVPTLSSVEGFPVLNEVKLDMHIHIDKSERECKPEEEDKKKKQVVRNLITLFHELKSTEFLTLSFVTIQVLSRLPCFLQDQRSPFDNLESLTLLDSRLQPEPLTKFPDYVIRYLLNNSPCIEVFIKDHLGRTRRSMVFL